MLPRALSSNLCSAPSRSRAPLHLCVEAEIDAERAGHQNPLAPRRHELPREAHLRWHVAHALGLSQEAKAEPAAQEMVDGLRVAYELSRILRSQRMKRGALDFELPEAKVILDPRDAGTDRRDPGGRKTRGSSALTSSSKS